MTYGLPIHITNANTGGSLCPGTEGLEAFVAALHKAIWVDGVNSIPPEKLSPDEVVYATQLYPDSKPTTIHDFYKSQQA